MSEVVELRQYTLRPGQRDTLTELFLRHFVDSQEAVGMRILGVYHDLDRDDRFVWLRSFPDMAVRKSALNRFYFESEAWKTYGPAANATMLDVSDVLLLNPLTALDLPRTPRLVATIHPLETAPDVKAAVWLETDPSENDFPRLPVRTDGRKAVWFNGFETDADVEAYLTELNLNRTWSIRLKPVG
ncbi:NIPSNAP family protein [Fodinicola acaciae]|uniref:NIPSNAP family protein n=1 Tax=Fodinicola acaciae TaxID=2681555 RepID=UPI001C9E8961|nr:NIPSNAP family protein [Fodinicola acaciae]